MSRDDDRDLRERFALLRREEETRATPLDRLLEATTVERFPRRRVALAPALTAVTVLTALGLAIAQILHLYAPAAPRRPAVSLAAWREPTAFLLHTPGHDFLSTVPTFTREMPVANPDGTPSAPVVPRSPAK